MSNHQDVVYIAGLSRSGSTILQMLLAAQPGMVGLGEVSQAIKKLGPTPDEHSDIRPCSCGAMPDQCEFWAPLLPHLKAEAPNAAHARIIERFRAEFPGRMLVDSSKTTPSLDRYYIGRDRTPGVNLKVLYVIRDFRGWVLSMPKFWYYKPGLRYGYIQDCYRWMYANLKAMRFLRESGAAHLCISYEDLVFNTERHMARIGDFLGTTFTGDPLAISNAVAHELYGNPGVKYDPEKRSRLVYDHTWLRDWRPSFFAPLLAPVYAFNQRVYREFSAASGKEKRAPVAAPAASSRA
jgi:hypothetical protein